MADEVGISAKLSRLLPTDKMKDSGEKIPGQDIQLRKRKKSQKESSSVDSGQGEEWSSQDGDLTIGKIVDIEI